MIKLKNELLPHQKEAVAKLSRIKVGALFMEQGTGKTITALEIARLRLEKKRIDSIIWLCPCSAKSNIKREIKKHCSEEMLAFFTICGIETLSTSIKANAFLLSLVEEKRTFLIIDESLLVKNPKAFRTKNITRLAEKCPYRIILNGTPVSRNEADLYSQFYLLDWRILGYKSFWSFSANHLEYDEYGKLRKVLNTDYLAKKIAPYSFQVTKAECVKLPYKRHDVRYFKLASKQWEEYMCDANILLERVNEWKSETIYRLFSALQAVISGKKLKFNKRFTHYESSEIFNNPLDNPRIQTVLDILDNKKTIIFCQYESEISQLCEILKEKATRFDGKVTQKKREKALLDFERDKTYLIANPACAGFSLNLQFCHRIIYMSNGWDLGVRLQSEDRVHRIGQEHEVRITSVCAEDTLDEQIIDCLLRKENLLDNIKNEIKKMNCETLKQTLKRKIYGNRGKKEMFDCMELEDEEGYNENLQ